MNYVVIHCKDCKYVDLLTTDLTKDVCPVCGETIFDYNKGISYKDNGILRRFESSDDYWTVYEILRKAYKFGFYGKRN